MEKHTPRPPIPWFGLILTFIVSTLLLVSLCLAILDTSRMELIQSRDTGCAEAAFSPGNAPPISCEDTQTEKG